MSLHPVCIADGNDVRVGETARDARFALDLGAAMLTDNGRLNDLERDTTLLDAVARRPDVRRGAPSDPPLETILAEADPLAQYRGHAPPYQLARSAPIKRKSAA